MTVKVCLDKGGLLNIQDGAETVYDEAYVLLN